MANTNNSKKHLSGYAVNCRGDVVELISHVGSRSFTLYKVEKYDTNEWIYMMFINNDVFPIVISEELAESIIANPSIGAKIAYNTWLERHH